jgi:DNA-directed RNA polymerase specialized sigma24 family protein
MNDSDANFGDQVGTLLPRLRRFARALTGTQDADDLVQLAVSVPDGASNGDRTRV